MTRIFLIFLIFFLAACAPATEPLPEEGLPVPTRTPGGPTLTPVSFTPPDSAPAAASEVLRFEGEGSGQGGPIRLETETTIRVNWQQYGEEVMQIFVVNTDPNQEDPRYKKVALALSDVPSVGYTDYTLIPGEYLLTVETGAGEWLVWVELITP
jgi:hypothetical protein